MIAHASRPQSRNRADPPREAGMGRGPSCPRPIPGPAAANQRRILGTAMTGNALVILGCGWIARRHAVAARRLGIPAIFASRDETRARAYAKQFGGIDAFG